MKCLLCKKKMQSAIPSQFKDARQPDGGGEIQLNFSYGSRFDQGLGLPALKGKNKDRLSKLLGYVLVAYLCDDCFEKNSDDFEGYKKEPPTFVKKVSAKK